MIPYYYKPKETMSKTGYIYKLCCNDPEITDCYVGSTKNEKVRKNRHKVNSVYEKGNVYNFYVYQFIRENGGFENWNMVRLEEFKFDERAQLNARERYWLETLRATLNKQIPTRTKKEYYDDTREKEITQKKIYYENNKERFIQESRENYQKNKQRIAEKAKIKTTCACGSTYNKETKARHLKTKKHKDYITSIPSLP